MQLSGVARLSSAAPDLDLANASILSLFVWQYDNAVEATVRKSTKANALHDAFPNIFPNPS